MSQADGENRTILLVEDDRLVLGAVRAVLEAQGCSILAAGSATEALQVCEHHPGPIHLLLTDVVMPEMNGRELAEQIRRRLPGIKVLYMTGYTEDQMLRAGLIAHEVALIRKPFSITDLARKVREVSEET
jgi:CheY-like chemotaxis protein